MEFRFGAGDDEWVDHLYPPPASHILSSVAGRDNEPEGTRPSALSPTSVISSGVGQLFPSTRLLSPRERQLPSLSPPASASLA